MPCPQPVAAYQNRMPLAIAASIEYHTLRREEFGAEVVTDIRCACRSFACAIRGRHVIRFVATVYTDDLALARRLVGRLVEPRIRDLLAITNNA